MGISCTSTDPARRGPRRLLGASCIGSTRVPHARRPRQVASASASDPARPAVFPATRRRFRVGMAEERHGGDVRASQQSCRPSSCPPSASPGASPAPLGPLGPLAPC
ncbi:hypothetical protein THAOC_16555 [Thalassiosira oceanica]|uniref:Uncharacterized protein n=1 Tax=Thalassiosira oceanica TaxID=159749 RepID=K0SD02_THAOC|nr:hypothetical protein THAOC_16555 [Thalassiosira oceanica]|eukprot:EJK62814.1 hypothetical protein THAOC_16555 [Thalassiosira oceanica]